MGYREDSLRDIIRRNDTAFRCTSREEVDSLIELVSSLYPEYRQTLQSRACSFGSFRFRNEICFRFEEYGYDRLDHGHGSTSYYRDIGRKIVDAKDILWCQDFGTFDTGFLNTSDALREVLAW